MPTKSHGLHWRTWQLGGKWQGSTVYGATVPVKTKVGLIIYKRDLLGKGALIGSGELQIGR